MTRVSAAPREGPPVWFHRPPPPGARPPPRPGCGRPVLLHRSGPRPSPLSQSPFDGRTHRGPVFLTSMPMYFVFFCSDEPNKPTGKRKWRNALLSPKFARSSVLNQINKSRHLFNICKDFSKPRPMLPSPQKGAYFANVPDGLFWKGGNDPFLK